MNLLVGVDLSESTQPVVDQATEIATAFSAKVWLLHIAEPEPDFVSFDAGPQSVRDSVAKRFHGEHRQLQGIAHQLRQAGLDATALLVQGPTVKTLLKEAEKLEANMIIMGTHRRRAIYELLVGSVSKGVLHQAQCPVLVVPN